MNASGAKRRTGEGLAVAAVLALGLAAAGCSGKPATGGSRGTTEELERLRADLAVLDPACMQFMADMGRPTTPEEGLKALFDKSVIPEDQRAAWKGPYLKTPEEQAKIIDQWNHPYVWLPLLSQAGVSHSLWSAGPDGQPYTEDDVWDFAHGDQYPPPKGKPPERDQPPPAP